MSRPFTSKIYNIKDEDFIDIVKSSESYSDALRKCGLENKGNNINTIKRRIKLMGIDDSNIPKGSAANKGRTFTCARISLENAMKEYLVENSRRGRKEVKKLVLRYNLIPNKCECGIENEWRGIPISLQLEHKNGISNDNRLENLCFLCPNCHSQTKTFAGKKTKKLYKEYDTVEFKNDCKILPIKLLKEKYKIHTFKSMKKICEILNINCPKQFRPRKVVNIPNKETLKLLIESTSAENIGKQYGISGNAIKKWCNKYGIKTKPRGYWAKQYSLK